MTGSRELHRGWLLGAVLVVWFALSKVLAGRATLNLDTFDQTPLSTRVGALSDYVRAHRGDNPLFTGLLNPIRIAINACVSALRHLISLPLTGSSIPLVGWLGVVAIIAWLVFATSTWRTSILASVLTIACGALGVWTESMDTLALVVTAVLLSLAVGIPVGIWAGLSDTALRLVTPILDLAQILPTLVYLVPLALVFLIGPASATIATMVYSIPIAIRITAYGIREVPASPVEAAVSMGTTRWQLLRKVQMPMAVRTIVLGVNQTTLAALSFAVIATLIGAPGLGAPVLDAMQIRDIGRGTVAGLAVVLLAIMLDRATSAAIHRAPKPRLVLWGTAVLAIVAVYLSRSYAWAAYFPKQIDIGKPVASVASTLVNGIVDRLGFFTEGLNTALTIAVLNPLEGMLANAPWFLTAAAVVTISLLLGGTRSALVTAALLAAIVGTGVWTDTMVTFAQTILAAALTMCVGVVLGVWIGRSPRADRVLRPLLDAGQVLPAFVYLIPMLGFFGPSRFTGIATGIVYSIPVVVKIVGQGIRDVPGTMVEAAISAGTTRMQLITKVQLPAAKNALLLAANQGLIFVLAVIVIGGLVGSGGLGYLVLLGTTKPEMQGKALLAGVAILLLGVMIDRITKFAALSGNRTPGPGRWTITESPVEEKA